MKGLLGRGKSEERMREGDGIDNSVGKSFNEGMSYEKTDAALFDIESPGVLHFFYNEELEDRVLLFVEERSCNIKAYSVTYNTVSTIVEGRGCMWNGEAMKPVSLWTERNGSEVEIFWMDEGLRSMMKYEVREKKTQQFPISVDMTDDGVHLSGIGNEKRNALLRAALYNPLTSESVFPKLLDYLNKRKREEERLGLSSFVEYRTEFYQSETILNELLSRHSNDRDRYELFYGADISLLLSTNNLLWTVNIGNGKTEGTVQDKTPALEAPLSRPLFLWADSASTRYVTDYDANRIYVISGDKNILTTFAGDGTSAYEKDGVPATETSISCPIGIWVDNMNNLYFADNCNFRIRKVSIADSIITTYAGTGSSEIFGDDGNATSAGLNNPYGLWGDPYGNIYFSEFSKCVIRKISSSQIISLYVGSYSRCSYDVEIRGSSTPLNNPAGIYVSEYGEVFFADSGNNRIRYVVEAEGYRQVQLLAGNGYQGYSGDNNYPFSASLNEPRSVFCDGYGYVYLADTGNNVIRVVNPSGLNISTLPRQLSYNERGGINGTLLNGPTGVFLNSNGEMYVVDTGNYHVRFVTVPSAPTQTPSSLPTSKPTAQPTNPSSCPTSQPTSRPTSNPTFRPTPRQTSKPTSQPTETPSGRPTSRPTYQPASRPTSEPSRRPTSNPTSSPSSLPTLQPTSRPSSVPSGAPISHPTSRPTSKPSKRPTAQPTSEPSRRPTSNPTSSPSSLPTLQPTSRPSSVPSGLPTNPPSSSPTGNPRAFPTSSPSITPFALPTSLPTSLPTIAPSAQPLASPTVLPSSFPSTTPSSEPSAYPSIAPSSNPSFRPISYPSTGPTATPFPTYLIPLPLYSSPIYKTRSALSISVIGNVSGQGYVWGGGSSGTNKTVLDQLQNVLNIVSSQNAFVAVKRDGSLLAWGSKSEVEGWWLYKTTGTVAIYATEHAFTGITAVGGMFAFGLAA